MSLDLSAVKKAVHTLKEAITLHECEEGDSKLALALGDAAIQRFEYTYELSWKLMQRWLNENVSPEEQPVYTQKELFRKSAQRGLIEDPLRWFEYHKARNVSAHTYNKINAETAFQAARTLGKDVDFLITQLEKRND